ncbi:MAG: TlpA disulfide reductase family protein [Pyrinomonadaceae bacterium]
MKFPTFLLFLLLAFSTAVFAQTSGNGDKPVAENFTAVSSDGTNFELSALKGKVVVLTFWSTKCPICHSEIPKLNRLTDQFKGEDVVFLAPTMNSEAMVSRYLKDNPFKFNILPNSFGIVLKYAERDREGNINMGFPAHFLIDQAGRIELKTSGFDQTEKLRSEIKRLLN